MDSPDVKGILISELTDKYQEIKGDFSQPGFSGHVEDSNHDDTTHYISPTRAKHHHFHITNSTVNHLVLDKDEFDPYEEKEVPGKLKWREGRYKMGKKQFLDNKYIFIPGKMMLQPTFNFGNIFKDFGLTVPSLVFRLSRSKGTSAWNVKLPQSRRYLADAFRILRENEKKQGGNTNRNKKNNPQHANLLYDKEIVGKYEETGQNYIKNLRGSIDHYHHVLDENCRRLLRSTNAACVQAQTIYRVNELWSDEVEEDVVAEWVQQSNPKGSAPNILGVADKTDFHPEIWAQFRDGCKMDYGTFLKDGTEPNVVVIDPHPFFSKEIPVHYDPVTGYASRSIPHPAITHLVISDNRILLEQKIAEVVQWGLILINGAIREAELGIQAVQLGLPMVAFKYTGGAADMIIEMIEKVDSWITAKRNKLLVTSDLPPKPFPDDMAPGYTHVTPNNVYLMPFDQTLVVSCMMLNSLVENWPDRFNKESIFVVDMFETPEDDVQDRITITVGSLEGGDYELGGIASEQKRISYAWRCRYKFVYNAIFYRHISDLLQILLIVFTTMSTLAATFYTYVRCVDATGIAFPTPKSIPILGPDTTVILEKIVILNVILPLLGTVIRGINAAISPYMKYVALTNASVKIESEVYTFRCKVAQYSTMKRTDDESDDDDDDDHDGGGDEEEDAEPAPNPRRMFWQTIDRIWQDLSASDMQNGTLRSPHDPGGALDDINSRISSNRREQMTYLTPIRRSMNQSEQAMAKAREDEAKVKVLDLPGDALDIEMSRSGAHSCTDYLPNLCKSSAKIASYTNDDGDEIVLDDGVNPLSADDYVIMRVIPMAAYMTNIAPAFAWSKNTCQGLNVVFSVMASMLTAFDLIPFIPSILALSGMVTALSSYYQLELRLMQVNSARNKLHQLLLWWESLTLIEKRVPSNKTTLVKKTEACIQAQATIFQGGGGSDGDDGDEGGD